MRGREIEVIGCDGGAKLAARKKPCIMIVEDDDRMRELICLLMQGEGFETVELGDGIEALSYLAASDVYRRDFSRPDLIVADINMPTYSGLDLLMGMRESKHRPPVILVTGDGDEDVLREGERLGAAHLVKKPFDVDRFLEVVEACLMR